MVKLGWVECVMVVEIEWVQNECGEMVVKVIGDSMDAI